MRTLSVTQGVVLDPFSILASGVLREHYQTKVNSSELNFLHGEAKFKQAFVNACHFAESMTVIGPIAQLIQRDTDPSLHAALSWRCERQNGDNAAFFDMLNAFMSRNNLDKIPSENIFGHGSDPDYRLHPMPDVTLKDRYHDWKHPDFQFNLFRQLFQSEWRQHGRDIRHTARRPNLDTSAFTYHPENIIKGTPVSALMAVIFTFKKPTGDLTVTELTNLAAWPPVAFLLPVLVPAMATINDDNNYTCPHASAVYNQPAMMTYQLRIPDSKNVVRRTLPYGQPYRLTTINQWGKEPDPLRSLSDVFKALWSQAAQYSAWSLKYDWIKNPEVHDQPVAELGLDPIGFGRRIRGHNRFSGKFNIHHPAMLWERGLDLSSVPPTLWGWDLDVQESLKGKYRNDLFANQLRSFYHLKGGKEVLFVFPSYFQEDSVLKDFMPTAITMARWMLVRHAKLVDFTDGNVVTSQRPGDGGASEEELLKDPELLPGSANPSFADRVASHLGQEDKQNEGALPVRRMKTPIGFNKTGDPTVLGLTVDTFAHTAMQDHSTTHVISDEQLEKVVNGIQAQGNFKFLDAFCSKSTKDLTDVFGAVSKKAVAKMKSEGYVDESMVVDLFDDMLD